MSENIRKPSSGLSLIQDIQLEHLLKSWNGGPFSTHVYTQLARIPQPIIEVVVFRKLEDAIETLIIPRPDDDIVWPGMYHNPGSALRTSDYSRSDSTPLNGPFERIQQSEIKTNFAYEPVLVTNLDRLTKRGPESCRVFFTELNGEPKLPDFIWSSIGRLKDNKLFIAEQLFHVNLAAMAFESRISK